MVSPDAIEGEISLGSRAFSLEHTLACGQVFRWRRVDGWWYGVVGEDVVRVRQERGRLLFGATGGGGADLIERYFRLDDDLPSILASIGKDDGIGEAIRASHGLRIIRQRPWECLVSYVCSANASIRKISAVLDELSRRFGKKVVLDRYVGHTFPSPETLARADLARLGGCGFRFGMGQAMDVKEIARRVSEGELDLEGLRGLGYEGAAEALRSLPGVGRKVADCVLLFSLDRLVAFPVDVWVKRAVLTLYGDRFERSFVERAKRRSSVSAKEYDAISAFGREYFGSYAGYAQEYLFYWARRRMPRAKGAPQTRALRGTEDVTYEYLARSL